MRQIRQIEDLLLHLVEACDPNESAKNSFDNYHVAGLRYVNLLRTDALTAKLYIANPGDVACSGVGVVNPHTHRYCFNTYVVQGSMKNIVLERTAMDAPGTDRWRELRYRGTPGKATVEQIGEACLKVGRVQSIKQGQGYYLNTTEIHTIRLDEDERTVLFLLQYRDDADHSTLFMPSEADPDMRGLYRPIAPDVIEKELDRVRNTLRWNRPCG